MQKLHHAIAETGLDALLVSQQENCRYLSGFTGSSGCLLISHSHTLLATDFRYIEQAKEEAPNYEITQVEGDLGNWLPELVSGLGWRKLGFEANHISFASHHKLSEAIETKQLELELIPTTALVEHLRSIKEPEELEHIGKATELTDAAFEYAKSTIHPDMTEMEAAWEIESFLRQGGSEGIPFDIIVASGSNSALPHAKPSNIIDCLISQTHPRDRALRDTSEVSNVECFVNVRQRGGTPFHSHDLAKFNECWESCLKRMKEDKTYKFIIEENDKLLTEAKNVKKEIVKRIEEPWKI